MSRYPEEEELETIRTWDYKDKQNCFEYISSIWAYPDYCTQDEDKKWHISTGGWSGNEDIIGALQDNYMIWALTWEQSRRGGHYIFDLGRYPDAS